MSIQNREKFLDHLAEKLGRERRKDGVTKPEWNYEPQWNVLADYTLDELVDVLEKQCEFIHTNFIKTDLQHLNEALLTAIKQYNGNKIIAWEDPRFIEFGLIDYFEKLRIDEEIQVHEWNVTDGEESIRFAEQADIGITFSDITLAESGTVVLFSSQGKGRSVSLLPEKYIAIIPKSTIVPRMSQATREIHRRIKAGEEIASCVNFISGPSNSADIEMNLVVGVHGPIHATYILVDDK